MSTTRQREGENGEKWKGGREGEREGGREGEREGEREEEREGEREGERERVGTGRESKVKKYLAKNKLSNSRSQIQDYLGLLDPEVGCVSVWALLLCCNLLLQA